MKIWHGYGSEHSMNLVMIGCFKSEQDAEAVEVLINKLTEKLPDYVDVGSYKDSFGDEVLEILKSLDCWSLSPSEIEHFLYEFTLKREGEKLILTSEESDVSAFIKLMMNKGAKVEVFSAHDYPDAEYGRGKR